MSIQVSPNPILKTALTDRDQYLTELLNQCQGLSIQILEPEINAWLQELRDRATNLVRQSTLPTKRDEEWRFTDLSALQQVKFHAVEKQSSASLQMDIAELTLPEAVNSHLVFVDGVYAPQLSAVTGLPAGVVVSNLAGLPITHRARVQKYLAQAEGTSDVFTTLNTAGITDAAIVWVPKNLAVEAPIQLLFISTASNPPTISQPRCLVVAESGSSATLIEDYWHHEAEKKVGDAVYFTNAVTEIWVEANAQVNHTRVERESLAAFHIGRSVVMQARDSHYTGNTIDLGAKLSRHNLEVFQMGEQTATTLNGLTTIAGQQLADTHSAIALNYPAGVTNQLHKCIVGDRAHVVFNGRVSVPQAAQLTNAGQLNRNLLLSPRARVDTKPQLEITADNVKCTHGATVSQLDEEEVFYLRSRGLSQTAARNLLINAFAAEIIDQLPVASLRQRLAQAVKQ